MAGKANTLVFPALQAGNIGYKIAQRFANAGAYGRVMASRYNLREPAPERILVGTP